VKQYYPRNVKLPEPGKIVDLVSRDGKSEMLGIVTGVYRESRIAIIRQLEIDEDGRAFRRAEGDVWVPVK
jgi:hypothetical protein